jgi:hypothetical protein
VPAAASERSERSVNPACYLMASAPAGHVKAPGFRISGMDTGAKRCELFPVTFG